MDKSENSQPLNRGPVYERINGEWVERCPMETNFITADIIYLETFYCKSILSLILLPTKIHFATCGDKRMTF